MTVTCGWLDEIQVEDDMLDYMVTMDIESNLSFVPKTTLTIRF